MRRLRIALLCVVALLGTFVSAAPAQAASSYDSYYSTTSSLVLHNTSCSTDIASSWEHYITDSPMYGNSYLRAKNHGSIGVSLLPKWSMDSTGTVLATAVIVYWDEVSAMPVEWTTWGYMAVRPLTHSVVLQATGSGSGCGVSLSNYGDMAYVSSNDGAVVNYFFNGSPNYPAGYEGSPIYEGTFPAPVPVTFYSGTIDCAGKDLQHLLIRQSGNDGEATLTYESPDRASWAYYLTSDTYSVTVQCGGDWVASYGSVAPTVGTDWICDPYGEDLNRCVLS